MQAGGRLTVSVVTPSLNQGGFLGRTLQSVAQQDYPGLEHVVVDGGSADQTLAILRAAARPGLSWVCERDRGPAHAVNKGIARSRGDIVAWLNCGDVLCPGAIATIAGVFAAHEDVDVVYGEIDPLDVAGVLAEHDRPAPFDLHRLHETCLLSRPATFFRRRCTAQYGLLDERLRYWADYEYWLRLGRAGARFAFVPVRLAGAHHDQDARPPAARLAAHREIIDMFLRLQGSVPDAWLVAYAAASVGRRLQRERNPWRFGVEEACISLLASLRWNHAISASLCRRLGARREPFRSRRRPSADVT